MTPGCVFCPSWLHVMAEHMQVWESQGGWKVPAYDSLCFGYRTGNLTADENELSNLPNYANFFEVRRQPHYANVLVVVTPKHDFCASFASSVWAGAARDSPCIGECERSRLYNICPASHRSQLKHRGAPAASTYIQQATVQAGTAVIVTGTSGFVAAQMALGALLFESSVEGKATAAIRSDPEGCLDSQKEEVMFYYRRQMRYASRRCLLQRKFDAL